MKVKQPRLGLSDAPFEVRSLSDRLTDVVRDYILSGEISPDVPIRQDALAESLNVSKIPIREALARLEQDGLVVSHTHRGFYVRPMSAEEAEEVYALRLKIEPEAAAYACTVANEEDRMAARHALDRHNHEASDELSSVGALNRAFHMALVIPGRRDITSRMVFRLNVISDRYVRKHLEPIGRNVRANTEHEKILNVWLKRKPEKVEELVTRHLEHTLLDLRKQLAAAQGEGVENPAPSKRRAGG